MDNQVPGGIIVFVDNIIGEGQPGVVITQVTPPPAPPAEPVYAAPPPFQEDSEAERQRVLKLFGISISEPEPLPAVPGAPVAPAAVPAAPAAPGAPAAPTAPVPGAPAAAAPGTPEAPAAPATAAPAAEAPPAPARQPRKLPKAAQPAAQPIDVEQAIRTAAEKIAATPPPAPAPAQPEVSEAYATRMEALRLMQQEPRYINRDLTSEYTTYLKKLEPYEEAWKKQNPDTPFDIDAADHEAWREKNEPAINEEELHDAEIQVKTVRQIDQRDELRRQDHFATVLANQARENATVNATSLLSFAEDGKQYTSLEELRKADWLAALVVRNYLPHAAGLSTAITTLLTPNSPVPYDPGKAEHREVAQQVQYWENVILSKPPAQRLDEAGRQYVAARDYVRLSPQDRQRAWTFRFAPNEMQALVMRELRNQAKADYLRQKEVVPAEALKAGAPPPPPATPTPPVRPPAGGSGPGTSPVVAPEPARTGSFWS